MIKREKTHFLENVLFLREEREVKNQIKNSKKKFVNIICCSIVVHREESLIVQMFCSTNIYGG